MRVLVTYGFNTNLEGCCSIVECDTYDMCMDKIHAETNMQYSFTYTDNIDEHITSFNLEVVSLQPMYSRK